MKNLIMGIIGFFLLACISSANSTIKPLAKPYQYVSHTNIQFHIKQNEGYSKRVYLDTEGHKTVGYGHKLPKKSKYQVGDFVNDERIRRWFQADYQTAINCGRRFLKNDYNEKELIVVTDMAFNLGCNALYEFNRFRKAINNHDYKTAAKEIRLSKYYKQVKNRAERNINILERI